MTERRKIILLIGIALLASSRATAAPIPRRALLIGINDYTASTLEARSKDKAPKRAWNNLDGAVNDVHLMRDLLIARRGFRAEDILILTDQQATRSAILRAIEQHLVRTSAKGGIALFYYSGHGSQVSNSRSIEADKLDESIVPADSRLGAPDIRDKELSAAFNRIIDRGARLTVVIDACFSGSGARGLAGNLRHRGISSDSRDVADATNMPKPEDRGALVISAAEDFDLAYETLADGEIRGAFSWAFARSLRDADPQEAASDTFLRATARLRSERPAQNPVLAGRADVRRMPFLGVAPGSNRAPVVAVETIRPDGTCTILGGWVHGITVGTRLRIPRQGNTTDLEVTSLVGAGRAIARISRTLTRSQENDVEPGTLLEVSAWAAPPLRKMRVHVPRGAEDNAFAIYEDARRIAADAVARGTRIIEDPTETSPSQLMRWRRGAWENISLSSNRATLFVQLPASALAAKAPSGVEGIELVDTPETAEYILTGRLTQRGIEYAWVRPDVTVADAQRTPMPVRSAWTKIAGDDDMLALRLALVRLVRVRGWHELQAPAGNGSHYRLAIRDARDGTLVEHGPLIGKRQYRLVLQLRDTLPAAPLHTRYVYVFTIDSAGQSRLVFPRTERGSIENRLPLTNTPALPIANPPIEIPLGEGPSFVVVPPYGIDSYFMLTTDSPLSCTACLEWDGVRTTSLTPKTPLETLLARAAGLRGDSSLRTSPYWSIDKILFVSVPPQKGSL